jgi:hypothetical protein
MAISAAASATAKKNRKTRAPPLRGEMAAWRIGSGANGNKYGVAKMALEIISAYQAMKAKGKIGVAWWRKINENGTA